MKSKQDIVDALNKLVVSDAYTTCPELKRTWEDPTFQKKISSIVGIKDTNSIKRNKSSYLFFCQEYRNDIIAENPDIKPNQIMIHLGEKWNKLSVEDKKKYDEMALQDRSRYITSKEISKKSKPVRISSYLQFCADERPALKLKHPDLPTKDITAKLGMMWNDYKKNNPKYLKTKYGYNIPENK